MLVLSSFAIPSTSTVLLQGMKITPFERPWSTMTSTASNPSLSGKSVIKSIDIPANGLLFALASSGCKGSCDGLLIGLFC